MQQQTVYLAGPVGAFANQGIFGSRRLMRTPCHDWPNASMTRCRNALSCSAKKSRQRSCLDELPRAEKTLLSRKHDEPIETSLGAVCPPPRLDWNPGISWFPLRGRGSALQYARLGLRDRGSADPSATRSATELTACAAMADRDTCRICAGWN